MKKVTMRDVAKAAGVSTATVSYVLNNNDKESIPEETKKRVMETAGELNYIPNLAARALTRRKSGLIGIFIMGNEGEAYPWRKSVYAEFTSELIKILYDLGYHAILEYIDPSKGKLDIIYERALDGVFLIDISEQSVYDTTNMFKVPIVLIDSFIEDSIFHKVLPDYAEAVKYSKKLLKEEEPIIIVDSNNSRILLERCCQVMKLKANDIYVIESNEDFKSVLERVKDKKAIIFNEFLALLARDYVLSDQTVVVCHSGNEYLLGCYKHKISFGNKDKAVKAAEVMIDYIDKHYHEDKYSFMKVKLV